MNVILWLLLFVGSVPLWISIGIRVERGRREEALAEYEEKQFQRGQRPGTVRLNSIKIRR
jgi:hypothetical protein